jgi:hypothetical protein
MSEHPSTEHNLSPFEAQLASLLPATTRLDRDQILFQAGRGAERRRHRRAMRCWQGLCALLLCTTISQWALVPRFGQAPTHQQLAVNLDDKSPDDARSPQSQVATPENPEDDRDSNITPPDVDENAIAVTAPSIEIDERHSERRVAGQALAVGTPPQDVWNEDLFTSHISAGFLSPPRTNRELLVELSGN